MQEVATIIGTPVVSTGVSFIWAISLGQVITVGFSVLGFAIFLIRMSNDMRWIRREIVKQNAVMSVHAKSINQLDSDLNFMSRILIARDADALIKSDEAKGE